MNRALGTAAALLGATGVLLGALGAHGLQDHLSPDQLSVWETAVLYHLIHAAVLVALAVGAPGRPGLVLAGVLFALGILGFSGSLYVLALGGPRWLGPVTPLGGMVLVAGWVMVGAAGWVRR